ncbi:hypothetical protein M404DRAFT_1001923 [Pisolithus tinctorius Marx 270]|uniref:EB1 C-terminal domain-containing protein n=1 Tax=Pisolithus tinctorius Marx 270 TaxID=870435 RepID=A0A0C3JZ73_PISTI|nr:hypothetical protein M404DRAFT_1001923 [Pisolithus tinctorius Marx 270]
MKRFWDSNYGGQGYDPVARRRGAPKDTPTTIAPLSSSRTGGASAGLGIGGRVGGKTPISGHRAGSAQPNEIIQNLQAKKRELTAHMENLEKERDFYFAKLRDIETLAQCDIELVAQQTPETAAGVQAPQLETLETIQKILYSTEDSFGNECQIVRLVSRVQRDLQMRNGRRVRYDMLCSAAMSIRSNIYSSGRLPTSSCKQGSLLRPSTM